MADINQIWRSLFPAALGSAVGAVGIAAGATPTPEAGIIVAQLISGLAINYASGAISPLLNTLRSDDWTAANFDLDRVATHALLTILHETLTESGLSRLQADSSVRSAASAWNLRIFRDADLTRSELVDLMRAPRALTEEQADGLAREMLRPVGHAALYPELCPAYSAAIAARFARTFEVLLRNDERAFRAATVYLHRLSLAELDGLRSDMARAVDILSRPQPKLERYTNLEKRDDVVRITDLQFKRRATRYRPRTSVDSSIRDWLLSGDRFRILKLTGPAGMGKSRLALQLCDWCHQEHWNAGFVTGEGWPESWTPNRDTLAVVDYAASKLIAGQSAFRWLESVFTQVKESQAGSGEALSRVRIVLIDRSDQGPLSGPTGGTAR